MKRLTAAVCTLVMMLSLVVGAIHPAAPIATVTAAPNATKLVAFTFDDGPSQYTTQLLDGMAKLGAKATFFVNGNNGGSLGAAFHTSKLNRMVKEGHQVANHTYQHYVPFDRLSASSVRSEVSRVNDYLYRAMGGNYQTLVRTPGGATSSTIRANVGAPIILWSVDTMDWQYRNSTTVYNNIVNNVGDGSIVLLHDIYSSSVNGALSAMLTLKNAGYEFVTVSELFRRRGITLQNGSVYYSAPNKGTTLGTYKAPTVQTGMGNVIGTASVTLSAASGLTLRYTTDGSLPTMASPRYTSPLSLAYDTTVTVAGFDAFGTRTPVTKAKIERQYLGVFDAAYYADHYEDARLACGESEDLLLDYYLTVGIAEGHQAAPTFNIDYYMTAYADLQRALGDDPIAYINHFMKYGMREGRRASMAFDPASYRRRYADLRRAYGNDWRSYFQHYLRYGYREGRETTGCTTLFGATTVLGGTDYAPVYRYDEFTARYPEIAAAYPYDDVGALTYFVETGMAAKMQGCDNFDVQSYFNRYADLRRAYGTQWKNYYHHYIRYGVREGREATGCETLTNALTVYDGVNYAAVYDYAYYTAAHPDVVRALGTDETAVLRHFVKYGMREGRRARESFNVHAYRSRYTDLQRAFGEHLPSYYTHYIKYGVREGRAAV